MYMIETLYVINENGIPLYTQNADKVLDPSLFAGFITALDSVVSVMGEDGFKKISMGMSHIYFIRSEDYNLFFVGIIRSKGKEKKVLKHLNQIKDKFCTHYDKEIKKFTGRLNEFMNADKFINLAGDPDNQLGKKTLSKRLKTFLDKI